jgi:hypothetical protein
MSDGGFHEAQINNMEMAPVSKIIKELILVLFVMKIEDLFLSLTKTLMEMAIKGTLAFHFCTKKLHILCCWFIKCLLCFG